MPREHQGRDAPLEWASVHMEAIIRAAWAQVEGARAVRLVIGELPAAWGDRELLELLWIGLLSCAVAFSAGREAPRIEVTGGAGTGYVVYGVRDNGAGFDQGIPCKLKYVRERIQLAFPGTGLALGVVQHVVARHQGNIWAEARPGEGSFLQFSLPLRGDD
jgi:two-component system sensor histidine kinase/response regulator